MTLAFALLDPEWNELAVSLSQVTVRAGLVLAPILIIIKLGWNTARGFTENSSLNYTPVMGGILIWILLFFYAEVMAVFSGAIGGFASLIPAEDGITDKALNTLADGKKEEAKNLAFLFFSNGFSLTKLIGASIVDGLGIVARNVMEFLRNILLAFIIITGPIALVFSLIPGFLNLLQRWFSIWLNVSCWLITLNILDSLVVRYVKIAMASPETSDFKFIASNIALLIMYIMVPWLTSLYAGSGRAGQFLSKVTAASAATAKYLASAASTPASSGAAVAAVTGSVTSKKT